MFKKVTTSKKTDYKRCVSYKEQMPYHSRLANSNAIDLRNNAKVIDLKKNNLIDSILTLKFWTGTNM